jgi:hypothetical protein
MSISTRLDLHTWPVEADVAPARLEDRKEALLSSGWRFCIIYVARSDVGEIEIRRDLGELEKEASRDTKRDRMEATGDTRRDRKEASVWDYLEAWAEILI